MQFSERVSMGFSTLLLITFAGMLIWGILGFLEYLFGIVLTIPLQNADFPAGTQFFHWCLITSSGAVYLTGYVLRWKHTPYAMVVIFGMMATACFIETFDFMTSDTRYIAFVLEIASYLLIGTYLLRSERSKARFQHSSASPA
jgi:hypothetical protein